MRPTFGPKVLDIAEDLIFSRVSKSHQALVLHAGHPVVRAIPRNEGVVFMDGGSQGEAQQVHPQNNGREEIHCDSASRESSVGNKKYAKFE